MFDKESDIFFSEPDLKGIYIAKVIDNADPCCLERVKVRVLGVHNWDDETKDNAIWAVHMAPSKANSGEIPDPDDYVYVMFMRPDDPLSCMWLGWARVKS